MRFKSKLAPKWHKKKPPYTVGTDGFLTIDLPKDRSIWVGIEFCYPKPFELVDIETDLGVKKGWWTGNYWDGYRISKEMIIKRWKRREDNITI